MHRSILLTLLKFLVIAISFGVVFYKLREFYFLSGEAMISTEGNSLALLGKIFLLMLFNWLLEALKWKELLKDIQNLSYRKAISSVITGITFGLLTPKRIGEVGGRVVMLQQGKRTLGALRFGLGSLIQTIITVLFGLIALLFIFPVLSSNPGTNATAILILSVTVLAALLFTWFNLSQIIQALFTLPFLKNKKHLAKFAKDMPAKGISRIFLYGSLRYLIFATQFFLFIRLFGSPISTQQAYAGIGLMYLVITFSPLSSVADLGIRGSVAVFVFGLFTDQTGGVVAASLALWIINLSLPALAGAILFYFYTPAAMKDQGVIKKFRIAWRRI